MPKSVPTPVAAAIGIVPTVLEGVLRVPGRAVQLPIHVLSSALTTVGTARREYDALAERGERLLARLRGVSFDDVEDRVEDALQGTPLAAPYDRLEDALEDAGETVTAFVHAVPGKTRSARRAGADAARQAVDTAERTAEGVTDAVGSAPSSAAQAAAAAAAEAVAAAEARVAAAQEAVEEAVEEISADEEPKGAPTPKATQPDATRIDTAAAPDVVQTVERVAAVIGGDVVDHDELPLPDYDHLTLGSLRGRMRSLDLPQLVTVRDYEKAHADRLPIVTMLDNRIAKLASDPTAPLSGGGGDPAVKPTQRGGSKVSPTTASRDTAPAVAFGGLGGASHPN